MLGYRRLRSSGSTPAKRFWRSAAEPVCDLLQFAKHSAIATGVDISERHVELARQRVIDNAEMLRADNSNLPFSAQSLTTFSRME